MTQCVFTAASPQRLRQNILLSEDNANNDSIKTALEFHKTIFCSQNCQGPKRFAIVRQGNRSWPAVQTVPSASAGLGWGVLPLSAPASRNLLQSLSQLWAPLQSKHCSSWLCWELLEHNPFPGWSCSKLLSSNRWAILASWKGCRHFFDCPPPISALVLGSTQCAVCWKRIWDRCCVLQLIHCGCYGIPITHKAVIQKWCSLYWLCISLWRGCRMKPMRLWWQTERAAVLSL